MSTHQIELGDEAKDSITGFSGVVVAITTWLNGCRRIAIQPKKLDKDGKPRDNQTFDVEQVVLVKAAKKPEAALLRKVGGPFPSPVRAADPTR
jgi:hypothetical protein